MSRRTRVALPALLVLLAVTAAPRPSAADERLLLHGERFHVTAEWRAPDGSRGIGHPIPLTEETGLFWFFSSTNVELVVKVLDACPVFQRYWVFASGLTDVEVTLTVEDRWSGELQRYQRPGGALFAPFADTASFEVCSAGAPACGHGSSADILASPRPDYGAEELALVLGNSVAAEESLYQRFHTDLEAIRAADPVLANASFDNIQWGYNRGIILNFTKEAWDAVRAGTYREWDCLNAWYRVSATSLGNYDFSRWAALWFEGSLHPNHTMADYRALPGVVSASINYSSCLECTPRFGLCATSADGVAYDYFVDELTSYPFPPKVPVHYYRIASPGAPPMFLGRWSPQAPPPSWQAKVDECYERLYERLRVD